MARSAEGQRPRHVRVENSSGMMLDCKFSSESCIVFRCNYAGVKCASLPARSSSRSLSLFLWNIYKYRYFLYRVIIISLIYEAVSNKFGRNLLDIISNLHLYLTLPIKKYF